jgi:response regulator NasT
MEWEGCSEREAFRRIRQTSMDTRTSMAEIARAILLSAQTRKPGAAEGA